MRAPRVGHERRCPSCGFDPTTVGDRDLEAAVRALGDRWVVFLDAVERDRAGATLLRTRPRDDGLSALECECRLRDHLRDLAGRVEERVGRTIEAHEPSDGDDDDPDAVVGDIARCTDEIAAALHEVRGTDAAVVRLAREALHDGYHHLAAAERSVEAALSR